MFTSLLSLLLSLCGNAGAATSFYHEKAPIQPVTGSVDIGNLPLSAFNDVLVAEPRPEVLMMFPYGLNTQISSTAFSGAGSTQAANNMVSAITGASANSSARVFSRRAIRYAPGRGAMAMFTAIFTPGVAASTQVIGAFDATFTDGFGFGFNGQTFGILHKSNGTSTWISTASWNGDKMDGTGTSRMALDITKGNVYKVSWQWLGFGEITFSIEDPATGDWIDVHSIQYANANTVPSVRNPSLNLFFGADNHANTTSINIKSASMGGFLQGVGKDGLIHFSTSTSLASVGTSEVPILSFRSTTSLNGIPNRANAAIIHVSLSCDSNGKPCRFRALRDASLTGAVWESVNSNDSILLFDRKATAATGERKEALAYFIAKGLTLEDDINNQELDISPGESITFMASTLSSGTSDVSISVRWEERF